MVYLTVERTLICTMKETAIIILLTSVWISNIFFISCGIYPEGLHPNKTTTCEEFSQFARFNPYSVLSDEWMVFYYWAPPQAPMIVKFSVPRKIHIDYLKYILEGHVLEPINWTAKSLLMTERDNRTYFLVEQSDRGHYLLYEPYKGLKEGDIIDAVDVRIKQTGDNRYIGIMACEAQTVFMFARVKDVPKRKYIQIEAARLNYKGRGGRSYLYQGHQWMPMPEAEDDHFEHVLNNRDKYSHK